MRLLHVRPELPAGCELIGAFEVGSGLTAVDATTWGFVRNTFAANRGVLLKEAAQSRPPRSKTRVVLNRTLLDLVSYLLRSTF